MMRKSQITGFILVGLIILIGVFFFVGINKYLSPQANTGISGPAEFESVKMYIDACLSNSLKHSAELLSMQGGYFILPEKSSNVFWFISLPYYYHYIDKDISPGESIIKQEFEKSVLRYMDDCTGNLSVFADLGMEIEIPGPHNADITFYPDRIIIGLHYPIVLKKDNKEYRISDFTAGYNHPFFELYLLSLQSLTIIKEEPGLIPVSEIISFASQNNIHIEISNTGNGDVIYSLVKDFNTTKQSAYNYAVKYYDN